RATPERIDVLRAQQRSGHGNTATGRLDKLPWPWPWPCSRVPDLLAAIELSFGVMRLAVSVLLAALLVGEGVAAANGKFPAGGQLVADSSDPKHIVVRTTFGLVTTRNAGSDWFWTCEDAIGYANFEPVIAVTHGGTVFVGLEEGVALAAGDGCTWSR